MSENSNALETPKEPETTESQSVIGIRFRSCGKIYTFKVDNIDVDLGDRVIVESEMGLSLGYVAKTKYNVKKPDTKFKRVLRAANEKDIETLENNRQLEEEAKAFCTQKAKEYNLEMKLVITETTLDRKRLIFYFTADGRIDFRELVRDLAAKFKTRIEMRQIGVRDEVKLLGGLGACGRQACCNLFLTSFAPITIRMAKEQDLSINQSKLSGICGRLMCCLGYEHSDKCKRKQDRQPRKKTPIAAKEQPAKDKGPVVSDKGRVTKEASEPRKLLTNEPVESKSLQTEGGAVSPDQKKTEDKEKTQRSSRRRRRRFRPRKQTGENQPQSKPAPPAASQKAGEQPKTDEANKGRPFSKRKRFWKKKKPTDDAK